MKLGTYIWRGLVMNAYTRNEHEVLVCVCGVCKSIERDAWQGMLAIGIIERDNGAQ